MKVSFTTMALPGVSLAEQTALRAEYGFDAMDIRMLEGGSGEVPVNATAEDLNEIRALLPEGTLSSIFCYNKQLSCGVSEMADSIAAHLKIAKALSAPAIRAYTGRLSDGDEELVCQALRRALAREPEGTILLQNHINCGPTVHQAIRICQLVDSERVKIAFSPDHCFLIGEDIPVKETIPFVGQLYIAGDETRNVGTPPGNMERCYRDILSKLEATDDQGVLTFKWERCWKPELAEHTVVFPQFLHWLHDAGINN